MSAAAVAAAPTWSYAPRLLVRGKDRRYDGARRTTELERYNDASLDVFLDTFMQQFEASGHVLQQPPPPPPAPPEAPPAPEPEPAVAVPKDALIPSYSDKIPHWEDHTLQQREDVARVAEQKAVIPVLTYSMIELVKSACLAAADAGESAASCWFSFALSDPITRALQHGMDDLWGAIGVPRSATDRQIRAAVRRISKEIHPDKCRDRRAEDAQKVVNEAAKVLLDEERREQYVACHPDPTEGAQDSSNGDALEDRFVRAVLRMSGGPGAKPAPRSLAPTEAATAEPQRMQWCYTQWLDKVPHAKEKQCCELFAKLRGELRNFDSALLGKLLCLGGRLGFQIETDSVANLRTYCITLDWALATDTGAWRVPNIGSWCAGETVPLPRSAIGINDEVDDAASEEDDLSDAVVTAAPRSDAGTVANAHVAAQPSLAAQPPEDFLAWWSCDDLLLQVLAALDARDLGVMAQVCRSVCAAIHAATPWLARLRGLDPTAGGIDTIEHIAVTEGAAGCLDPVLFPPRGVEPQERHRPPIRQLATLLRRHARLIATIEGHCDYAERTRTMGHVTKPCVSRGRAKVLRHVLLVRGAPPERVRTVAFGASRPMVPHVAHNVLQPAENRRVEIRLSLADGFALPRLPSCCGAPPRAHASSTSSKAGNAPTADGKDASANGEETRELVEYDAQEEIAVMRAVVAPAQTPPPTAPPRLFFTSDSFALFSPWWSDTVGHSVGGACARGRRAAFYIGALNGDIPELFDVFESVVLSLNLGLACHHARMGGEDSALAEQRKRVREQAALILIAGGDHTRSGWEALVQAGLDGPIKEAQASGAVVVGVADGATLLGPHTWSNEPLSDGLTPVPFTTFPALGLTRYVVGVNEESDHWKLTEAALMLLAKQKIGLVGLGLPKGSSVAVHTDGTLEPAGASVQTMHSCGRAVWVSRGQHASLADEAPALLEQGNSARPKLGPSLAPAVRHVLTPSEEFVTVVRSFEREIVVGPHKRGEGSLIVHTKEAAR